MEQPASAAEAARPPAPDDYDPQADAFGSWREAVAALRRHAAEFRPVRPPPADIADPGIVRVCCANVTAADEA